MTSLKEVDSKDGRTSVTIAGGHVYKVVQEALDLYNVPKENYMKWKKLHSITTGKDIRTYTLDDYLKSEDLRKWGGVLGKKGFVYKGKTYKSLQDIIQSLGYSYHKYSNFRAYLVRKNKIGEYEKTGKNLDGNNVDKIVDAFLEYRKIEDLNYVGGKYIYKGKRYTNGTKLLIKHCKLSSCQYRDYVNYGLIEPIWVNRELTPYIEKIKRVKESMRHNFTVSGIKSK